MKRPKVTLVRGQRGPEPPASLTADELAAQLSDNMTGQHFVTSASCAGAVAVILDAAMRGASLTLNIEQPFPGEEAFLDELRRVADVSDPVTVALDPGTVTLDPVTVALLELLTDGGSTTEAARRLHLSTRSAYRMLSAARTALGVSTNMEALLVARPRSAPATDP